MATKARQQYFADEDSLQKIRREFSIADDIQQKIDSIEPGAQVNKIETVKVNGTALVPDANKAVNVEVPEVIDNLYTVDSDNALSAKQGKLLYDYIQNIASRGRFLSNWNSATGLPMTNPSESPYPYKSGDYFVVSNVATSGGTNYRPDGSSYIIGQASTVVETEDVSVSDFYFYDGTNWLLLSNSGRQIAVDSSLSTTSTNPVENRVITNALNGKQETLVAGSNIQIAADGKTISATNTTYTAGANVQISNQNVISATDTTYTAGTGISIDANNVISNTQTSAEWGNITGTLADQTDLQNALNIKGDMKYADYNWVTKTGNSIELSLNSEITPSTDFTVNAPSTIKDGQTYLLRVNSGAIAYAMTLGTNMTNPYSEDLTLSANEVSLFAFTAINGNLELQPRMKETDLSNYYTKTETDTLLGDKQDTLTAGTGISIDANNVISSTATSAQWGNITGTLSNQTDLQNALDSKVNLGINKVFDNTVVEIGKWEHEPGGDSSGHHIELDPNGEVSTYNLTQAGHNEATLGSGTLELLNNTVLDGNKTATFDHEKIVADDGTDTETYNFFGNNRIARLSDVGTGYTAGTGINIDANNIISNTLPGATVSATAPSNPSEGDLWYDTANDALKAYDGTNWNIEGTRMTILKYGISTWNDFITAYNDNAIVYCRASNQSNPATGSQTRMAFMAYVNNEATPTEVEFQYYRSRSDHNSAANQLDQVFVYKLTSASGGTWTVTERNTAAKATAGTGISLTYGSGNMTISADTTVLATQTDLNSKQDTLVSGTNIKTVNNQSLLGSGNITISAPTYTAGENITIDQNNEISATDTKYNAGTGISIGNATKNGRQGPSPDGFHVPAITEWQGLNTIMTSLSLTTGDNWRINLHMPFSGRRYHSDASLNSQGTYGYYWSSSPNQASSNSAPNLRIGSSNVDVGYSDHRAFGFSIRCFKNEYVTPDSSWTVVQGTLGSAGIFWNQTEGLISITDGTTGYTIMDKNLGATTVYNDGDTLTEANMGNMYQWGNNYGFPSTGTITNTSSTQVDTSGYGPGNYYSSDTFIAGNYNWSSVNNEDLWGDTTGTYTQGNVISNTGVTSVNGQTGDVILPTGLQESPNSTITGIKYIRHGTEADYANLSQYYTDTPGDTEFHCF